MIPDTHAVAAVRLHSRPFQSRPLLARLSEREDLRHSSGRSKERFREDIQQRHTEHRHGKRKWNKKETAHASNDTGEKVMLFTNGGKILQDATKQESKLEKRRSASCAENRSSLHLQNDRLEERHAGVGNRGVVLVGDAAIVAEDLAFVRLD